jgi:hypothetical protein
MKHNYDLAHTGLHTHAWAYKLQLQNKTPLPQKVLFFGMWRPVSFQKIVKVTEVDTASIFRVEK